MKIARLQTYAGRWQRALWLRELAWAGAVGLIGGSVNPWLGVGLALVVLGLRLKQVRPWKMSLIEVTRHWDRVLPEFEESSGLWLRDEAELSVIERMQRKRLAAAHGRLVSGGDPVKLAALERPQVKPSRAIAALVVGAGCLIFAVSVGRQRADVADGLARTVVKMDAGAGAAPTRVEQAPRVVAVKLVITPPAYTGRAERDAKEFDVDVEEGARVQWSIAVEGDVRALALAWGAGSGRVELSGATGTFFGAQVVSSSVLYRLVGTLADGTRWEPPMLYALRVIKDQAPVITLVEPAVARTEIGAVGPVAVRVTVKDDYAVGSAQLIATVAKGSGEGVKFREQAMAFDAMSGPVSEREFTKTIDLRQLGMEPGDELYFFVTAKDNRAPVPNQTRSETRFIAIKGPEQATANAGRGMRGVNLVPEYFRSQRQIIIDTEKLLVEQATLTPEEFRRRSENLGIDQKLLRLRYGQFLGEEFEPEKDARPDPHAPVAASVGEFVAQLTQKRQTGPAPTSRVPLDRPVMVPHDHGPETGSTREGPKTAAEITAEFAHLHDKADEATFFDSKQKANLKDVLAAMWESEGKLRVIQPAAALPAEHRALEMLKELQEGDRAYVQRVGFEAAPIKVAERRLRGELESVPQRGAALLNVPMVDAERATVRAALSAREDVRAAWKAAEPVLTKAATREPERFLEGLQALRVALAEERISAETQEKVQRALWKLLPAPERAPTQRREDAPALAEKYFKALSGEGAP